MTAGKGMGRVRQAVEPLIRRCLHTYWRVSRGLTLGVRAVVIDDESRVFLVKHSYVTGWYLPGGGVEAGETLLDALARELAEEGAIELIGVPTLHGIFHNPRDSRRDHVALFIVRTYRQGIPKPDHEIIDHGFFPLHALPDDATPATRARLAEVFGGAGVTETW